MGIRLQQIEPGGQRFERNFGHWLVQAVLLHLHPDLSLPPVRQPDGGHDAFQLQDDTGVKVFSASVGVPIGIQLFPLLQNHRVLCPF